MAPLNLEAGRFLLDDTFESYTPGSAPEYPGDGNNSPWIFHNRLTPEVHAASSTGGTAPNERVLTVTRSNEAGYAPFGRQFERQIAETSSVVQIQFQLRINSLESSNYSIQFIDGEDILNSDYSLLGGINISSDGNVALRHRTALPDGGITSEWNPQKGVLLEEAWYQFNITLNLQQQSYSVEILNLNNLSQGGTSKGNLYFIDNAQGINGLLIRPTTPNGTANALDWSLDDVRITVTSIPEPSGVALASLVGLGCWGAHRFALRGGQYKVGE